MKAAGENIKLVGDNVNIAADVRSAGAVITLHPTDSTRPIVIGNVTPQININGVMTNATEQNSYFLTTTEFGKLKDGFGEIVIGSEISSSEIQISSAITFNDSLTLNSPALGGEIIISGNLVGAKDAEFVINGSGHTTTLNANISTKSDVTINDSMKISGLRKITATQGDIILGQKESHFLDGDNVTGDDKLTLRAATGDIVINGKIGGVDALEGLSITKAKNVSFNNDVKVDGNLSINARGTVAFNSSLDVTGILTIHGAEFIKFENKTIPTNGHDVVLKKDVVKSLEKMVSYYDKAENDIFYFWTENVRL